MTTINAYRMDGLGNDFIIIDRRKNSIEIKKDKIIELGNRANIGFDQIIFIEKQKEDSYPITIYNSDGGEVSACGNGARCSVKFAQNNSMIEDEAIFDAFDGNHYATILGGFQSTFKWGSKSDQFLNAAQQLLILDDPLESIDIDAQPRVRDTISEFLREGFSSIQLCRRYGDILPVATHLAVMESLQVVQHGKIDAVRESESYLRLLSCKPNLVREIPGKEFDKDSIEDQEPLIKMNGISASYGGVTVFKGFDWSMGREDYVLIEGPNGCGKSTLLSLINGENHKAYGQSITLFGRKKGSGETIWELKEKFGVVSNELHNKYIKGWRVLEVVVSGFFDSVGLYDESGTREKEMAMEWLSTLGLNSLVSSYYHEVSFGEQRLILLARAMVKRPKILILDEPCVGLDDYYRQLILNILDLIAEQTRTNLIYVSHVKDEKPRCINVHLSFERGNDGSFRIATHSV